MLKALAKDHGKKIRKGSILDMIDNILTGFILLNVVSGGLPIIWIISLFE